MFVPTQAKRNISPCPLLPRKDLLLPVATAMSNQPPAAPAAPSAASTKITEIRIGCPNEYDGKAETAQAWLDSVRLYLLINHTLYYDDDRKIAFTLSYMKKGSTAIWAEACRQQGLATLSFGTFTQFQQDFKNTFVDTNTA